MVLLLSFRNCCLMVSVKTPSFRFNPFLQFLFKCISQTLSDSSISATGFVWLSVIMVLCSVLKLLLLLLWFLQFFVMRLMMMLLLMVIRLMMMIFFWFFPINDNDFCSFLSWGWWWCCCLFFNLIFHLFNLKNDYMVFFNFF